MPVPQRLSLVTLGVADVARSTEFYESLGWRRAAGSQDAITFFSMQGSVVALFGRDDLAGDAGAVDVDRAAAAGFRGVSLAINCDSEAEVDAAYEEFVAAGARAASRPERAPWGGYSGYVADPDGHLWEIAYNPLSPNDADGRMMLD